MEHTLANEAWVAQNPAARAQDLMRAFADPTISGIVASIGGDDSIRLLPLLDLDVIRRNPKVFLGFSDPTCLHFACQAAGLSSFYGPTVMAGLAENAGMHRYTIEGLRKALFAVAPIGSVSGNTEGWTTQRLTWADPSLQTVARTMHPADSFKLLQGAASTTGRLIGGCAEVLEMLKGTTWWPPPEYWKDCILFYETSEESPSPNYIRYWFRNLAAQGILSQLSGIVLARPDPGGDETYRDRMEAAVTGVLAEEGLHDLPVLAGLDFGHTQPMMTLPYGAMARIDCSISDLIILEAGVV
jgi:muramoyltetrapeptide carboxypeptidase LdcA involved in peptidoglycan recycling